MSAGPDDGTRGSERDDRKGSRSGKSAGPDDGTRGSDRDDRKGSRSGKSAGPDDGTRGDDGQRDDRQRRPSAWIDDGFRGGPARPVGARGDGPDRNRWEPDRPISSGPDDGLRGTPPTPSRNLLVDGAPSRPAEPPRPAPRSRLAVPGDDPRGLAQDWLPSRNLLVDATRSRRTPFGDAPKDGGADVGPSSSGRRLNLLVDPSDLEFSPSVGASRGPKFRAVKGRKLLAQTPGSPNYPLGTALQAAFAASILDSTAQLGRRLGMTFAPDLLDHYLDGSGEPRRLESDEILQFTRPIEAIAVNRERFATLTFNPDLSENTDPKTGEDLMDQGGDLDIRRDLARLEEGESMVIESEWMSDENILTNNSLDLSMALGTWKLTSTSDVTATRHGSHIYIDGTVLHKITDTYDFEPGEEYKGYGHLAWRLADEGFAAPFEIEGEFRDRIRGRVTLDDRGRVVDIDIEWEPEYEMDE